MTTTPQAALLSFAELVEIDAMVHARCKGDTDPNIDELTVLARELEKAILAKLQATQAEPMQARWYSLDALGMATLCRDEDDAKAIAIDSQAIYPHNGPYRAVQMAPVEPVQAGELPEEPDMESALAAMGITVWGPRAEAFKAGADWQAALSARKPLTDETFVAACNGCPTPGKCKDTSGCASAGMNVPTYYVRHPDDTYTAADPQPRFNDIGLEVKP